MVTLNFTLLVELGLFLLFVWGTSRFILQPTLRHLDARAEQLRLQKAEVEQLEAAAAGMEETYERGLSQAKREGDDRVRAARAEALAQHDKVLRERKRHMEAVVTDTHKSVRKEVQTATSDMGSAIPDLVTAIERQLRLRAKP